MTESDRTRTTMTTKLRTFLILWSGQVVSIFGTSMTGFALGVWVFQTTGSVTRFALISFSSAFPAIVLLPASGIIVDRFNRLRVMIWGDLGAALGTVAIAALLWLGYLEIWHIYVLMAFASAFSTPQALAFDASIPLLVDRQHLGRANALHQFGAGIAETAAPLLAGLLVVSIGLEGIILIDVATFVFAVMTLLIIRIPRHEPSVEKIGKEPQQESLKQRLLAGWHFIRSRPGLVGLMFYFFSLNFTRTAVLVLLTPLVLSFAAPTELGAVLALGAAGMMTGGILMAAWGGPERRMTSIYAGNLLYSVMLILGGLRPNITLISVAAFLMLLTSPFINSAVQALWQSKVPFDLQGRVFAARRMFTWSAVPLGYLISGPLSDRLFEPLMAEGGALAGALGPIFGVGPGRGVGLFLTLLGVSALLTLAAGYLHPRIRLVEDELPDVSRKEAADPERR